MIRLLQAASNPLLLADALDPRDVVAASDDDEQGFEFVDPTVVPLSDTDRIHRQGMPPGKTAHVEIPHLPCAIERVLNRRLSDRQERLYGLLDAPMPVVGFDDESQQGFFDLEDVEGIDELFEEVLADIRADHGSK